MAKSHIEFFERAVKENPDDSFKQYSLGMEYRKADRLEESLAAFEQVIAGDPGYVPAYQMAGEISVALGKVERARAILVGGIDTARRARNLHAASKMKELLDTL